MLESFLKKIAEKRQKCSERIAILEAIIMEEKACLSYLDSLAETAEEVKRNGD